MFRMKTCCFYLDLRRGTFASALYTMVLGIIAISTVAATLQRAENKSRSVGLYATSEAEEAAIRNTKIWCYVCLVLYALWTISAMLVIFGVKIERRSLLIPWMIFTAIVIVLILLAVIFMLVAAKRTFSDVVSIITFFLQIITLGINIYAELCVINFYKAHLSADYYY